jgi:hypothetical protein
MVDASASSRCSGLFTQMSEQARARKWRKAVDYRRMDRPHNNNARPLLASRVVSRAGQI